MTDNGDDVRTGGPVQPDQPVKRDEDDSSDARPMPGFDPTPYMRQLRGRGGAQDYLDVKFRLLWLRREHPDAEILTEHVRIDDASAIFKATVTLPSGGKATGYGSETVGDFGDFIEKAETKAIGRALNALGYGVQFADGEEDPGVRSTARPRAETPPASPPRAPDAAPRAPARPHDATAPRAATPTTPTTKAATTEPTRMPQHRDTSERPEHPAAPNRPDPINISSATRDRVTPPAATPSARPPLRVAPEGAGRPPSEADPDAEPALEDYSWTAFWSWARPLGFENRGAIEALIGQPITSLSPAEVRDLIREKRSDE